MALVRAVHAAVLSQPVFEAGGAFAGDRLFPMAAPAGVPSALNVVTVPFPFAT